MIHVETERLRLRPYEWGDVDDLHRLWTDADVRKYLWDDVIITRERVLSEVEKSIACFESHGFGQWAVFPSGDQSLIGFCGFGFVEGTEEVELLYGIAPAYWGRGLASEASRAVLRYGFEERGLERILAGADPPNSASFRVMERVGMTFAKRMHVNNQEIIYYAVSRQEFQPGPSTYHVRRVGCLDSKKPRRARC